jgi:putative colanic acid biosynthesis acetyltransferase WcaF
MSDTNPQARAGGRLAADPVALGDLVKPQKMTPMVPPSPMDKLRRAVWIVVWLFIFQLVPTPFFSVRCMILRMFGATIARGARPYPRARIWAPWNLEMRPRSCLANGVNCYNVARVTVLENCTVSQRAFLCTASHDLSDREFQLIGAPIVIGPTAWVCAEAFIGPGVSIGESAVVGARAVVTRSVPTAGVVVGNPARMISMRQFRNIGQPQK